ncbi:SusC/RagA family TonB-linked outer membrane protein [Prolixibacteraceae bacterium JC049]|nr:SusC/RagA family TonB-linked outer membrane protein [Prolixibacteraceae bacterium JC049]
MRLTTHTKYCTSKWGICIITILFVITYFSGYAQKDNNARISLQIRNVKLEQVLLQVEKLSGIAIVYESSKLPLNRRISLNIPENTVDFVLTKVLKSTQLTFQHVGNYIIISKKKANVSLQKSVNATNKFKHHLSGIVTDISGMPLPGVNVYVRGSTDGVATDNDGFYLLSLNAIPDSIHVSYIGYLNQSIPINDKKLIHHIKLLPDTKKMDEVVVVGFGTQRKVSLIGAISSLKISELKTSGRSLNNALAGKLAGIISIQRSGEPGYDDASFWIRGISTFGENKTPLILVDGIERSITDINPEELESISILKDATATAVYGVRGANGVIMTTTRRGQKGPTKISVKAELGKIGCTQLPEYLDGATHAELFNEGKILRDETPFYTQEAINKYRSGEDPDLYPNVNWMQELIKPWSSTERVNLSALGGAEKIQYFVNASYYKEEGIYKTDNLNSYNTNVELKRYTFRSNIDFTLNPDNKINLGISGTHIMGNYPGYASDALFQKIANANPTWYPMRYSTGHLAGPENGSDENPYALITQTGYVQEWRNEINSNLKYTFNLDRYLPGLSFSTLFAFDIYDKNTIGRQKSPSTWLAESRDENGNLILRQTRAGQDYLGFNKSGTGDRSFYIESALRYNWKKTRHHLNLLFLYNQRERNNSKADNSIDALPYRNQGLAGRASYAYDDRFFTEFNFGYNGSENFSKENRFGFFPSIAAGWIISNEQFFHSIFPKVDMLKLKVSHGLVGNDKIGGRRFVYQTTVGNGHGGYALGTNKTYYYGRGEDEWGNANATWETSQKTNWGLELQLFKKLLIQFDQFFEVRKDIFMQRKSLPSFIGVNKVPWANIGKMKNNGFDLYAQYNDKIGKLAFSIRATISKAKNKIIENDEPAPRFKYQSRKGFPTGQQFGLVAQGLFSDSLQIINSPKQTFGEVRPGDIRYKDINNDGVIDDYDKVPIGKTDIPELLFGIGTSLQYKNFDFSIYLQGITDVTIMLENEGVYAFTQGGKRGHLLTALESRWTPTNNTSNVFYPRLTVGHSANNNRNSTWWQRDASFIRLKNIEFGYSIPRNLSSKLRVDNFRLYLSGVNLYTWSKFKLWDPEMGGGRGADYPPQKLFSFGLEIKF